MAQKRTAGYDFLVSDDLDRQERKRKRQSAEVRRFGPGEAEQEADADALYWDRIPVGERAQAVWELSVELFALARQNGHEPGL